LRLLFFSVLLVPEAPLDVFVTAFLAPFDGVFGGMLSNGRRSFLLVRTNEKDDEHFFILISTSFC
jgi:hypothetical protein